MQNGNLVETIIKSAMKNPWISGAADIADGDPLAAIEYELSKDSFKVMDLDELVTNLLKDWARNTAFIWGNFAFINQVNGGIEWAVFKYVPEDDTAFQFESISIRDEEELRDFLHRIEKATDEQLINLEY